MLVLINNKDLYHITDLNKILQIINNFSNVKLFNDFNYVMNNIFNPKLEIKSYDNKFVIRDDLLIGGTKQRALYKLILQSDKEEFIYAGPSSGYAQIALAYCCALLNRKATLFITGSTKLTEKALSYPNCTIYTDNKTLAEAQNKAEKYAAATESGSAAKKFLVPFGLDFPEYIKLLVEQLKIAARDTLLYPYDRKFRLWVTVGSGTLLKAFSEVWPNATFLPVQVGKAIKEENFSKELWQRMGGSRLVELLRVNPYKDIAPIKGHQYQEFHEEVPENLRPPYPALLTYDAKVWQRVLMYGKKDDFIWSTGAELF